MSNTVVTPRPQGDQSTRPTSRRARLTRTQTMLVLLVLALLALTVVGALTRGARSADLDPDSYRPNGSHAVMAILADQGVNASVVRSKSGLRPDANTTIVIGSAQLTPLDTLKELKESPADLVLIAPSVVDLSLLGIEQIEPSAQVPQSAVAPQCADATAAVGVAAAGGNTYQANPSGAAGSTAREIHVCFPSEQAGGSWVSLSEAERRIVVIGQSEILRNRSLAKDGNAALALRSLGRRPALQWYVPNPAELADAEEAPGLLELIPAGVKLLPLALALPVLGAMFWRGRRFGRLVTEPLPVLVRASETVEGRARMYRRAKARGRAASLLRTAAARRLATQVALVDAEPQDLIVRVADLGGRPVEQIRTLLLGGPPTDDDALLRLASDLDALEAEIRSRTTSIGPRRQDGQ